MSAEAMGQAASAGGELLLSGGLGGPDAPLVASLHSALSSPAADLLLGWVSSRFLFAFPLLALVGLLLWMRFRKAGLVCFLALLCALGSADLLGNALKHLIALPRPCFELRGVLSWIPEKCSGAHRGMPSNHALNFFTVAAFVTFALRRFRKWPGICLFLTALLVGVSRIYLARHYPSQVIAGAFIGTAWGTLWAWACGRTPAGRGLAENLSAAAVPAGGSETSAGELGGGDAGR